MSAPKKLFFLFVLFLYLPLGINAQTSEDLKKFKKGVELLEQKHYHEAIEIFKSLKSIPALSDDCEQRIKDARKRIAYIMIKSDDKVIDNNEKLVFNCSQTDTLLTVVSNYNLEIDAYTSGLSEVKIKGNKLYISLANKNKTVEDKLEFIKISAGKAPNKYERTIEIVQKKAPAYLKCSSESLNSPAKGFIEYITVDTNIEWGIEFGENWCNVTRDSNQIKILVKENITVIDRSTQLYIKPKSESNENLIITINIIQKGEAEELIPFKSDLNMPADGKTEFVRVYSNDSWQVKNHPSWCRVTRVLDTDSLKFECTENISGVIRDEYAIITTRSGNKIASIRITQPSNDFVPKYPLDVLGGRNISVGIHAGGLYPMLHTSSAGKFMGSVVNYGLGNTNENASYKMKMGFSAGILADLRLYKNLYMKTGLDYSMISYSNSFKGNVNIIVNNEPNISYKRGLSTNSYTEDYTFHFINVPILASYRFVLNRSSCIHVDFGAYMSYGLSATMDLYGTTDSERLYKYKIVDGVYTSEKISDIYYSTHFRKSASIDLYKNSSEMKEVHTLGTDLTVYQEAVLSEAPFKRFDFGLQLGASYEYAGFCINLCYKRGISNMANNKYWESERLPLYQTVGSEAFNMSGYKQFMGYLSLSASYIFRH